MFGASVLLAALAFAGAPAGTPVACNPDDLSPIGGQTYWPNGRSDPATASIQVGTSACAALLLLQASPAERDAIAKLNPGKNFLLLESAVSTVLHEASHVAMQSGDETNVECRAMALLPDFLSKYLSGSDLATTLDFAKQTDSFLPAAYHTHPC